MFGVVLKLVCPAVEHQGSFVVITDGRVSNSNDLNEMVLLYLRRRLKSIIVDGKNIDWDRIVCSISLMGVANYLTVI